MTRIRQNFFISEQTKKLLLSVQSENNLRTFGEAIDYIANQYQMKSNNQLISELVADEVMKTFNSKYEKKIESLMARSAYADKRLSQFTNILNHLLLKFPDLILSTVMGVDNKKSPALAYEDEKHKQKLIHFKQNADNKKLKQATQQIKNDTEAIGDYDVE